MDSALRTKRLTLRRPQESDADAIIAIAGDWNVARRLARVPHPYSSADLRFFFEHVVPAEPTWAIVWSQSDELIGMVGLAPAADGGTAELGYYVAPQFWGRGIATEAAAAILKLGFGTLGFSRITSGYHADNPSSGRVLAKLGFTIMGSAERPCLAEGRTKPSVELECTGPPP